MKSIGMFSFDQETITVYTKTNTVPFKTITNSMRIFVLFIIFFSAGNHIKYRNTIFLSHRPTPSLMVRNSVRLPVVAET